MRRVNAGKQNRDLQVPVALIVVEIPMGTFNFPTVKSPKRTIQLCFTEAYRCAEGADVQFFGLNLI